ncbi:hypothetical protein FHG87_021505 [Trinorchestia longiramus]|nr:hypothetical protein FHG87_021505 [Trinorchestia longiramus]
METPLKRKRRLNQEQKRRARERLSQEQQTVGLSETRKSDLRKLVFECWKCMTDGKVKMEEENKRLKVELISLRNESKEEKKLKGGKKI